MSPAAAFHAQLASIMEVLANTAVAEICELVDSGYSVLQLEISRSRKENEVLRRRLRLMELRAARAAALRAAATASGAAPPHATVRARAQPPAHHPGNHPRRSRTPAGEVVLSRVQPQEPPQPQGPELTSDPGPDSRQPAAGESDHRTTAVIKVEEEDESWSRSEDNAFCRAVDGQATESGPPPPPPPTKQEAADEGGDSSQPWTSGEVSSTSTSTSTSVQNPPNAPQRPETGTYERLMYESHPTHNPLGEDPGCSYALDPGAAEEQQGAPPVPDQLVRKAGRQGVPGGRDRGGDRGGAFVCTFCGKSLSCLKNLKTHMRVHTGEKPFVCALCAKRFSDSSNLKRHQSVHTGEKRYGCVHCGKRFAQSGSLKVHMSVHTDCKQFRCSLCGKTFISGSHLRRHVTVHGGERRFSPSLQ